MWLNRCLKGVGFPVASIGEQRITKEKKEQGAMEHEQRYPNFNFSVPAIDGPKFKAIIF